MTHLKLLVCLATTLWTLFLYTLTLCSPHVSSLCIPQSLLTHSHFFLSLHSLLPLLTPSSYLSYFPPPLPPTPTVEMVTQPESQQILIGPDPPESEALVHREWWHKFLPFDKLKCYCCNLRRANKSPIPSADREELELSSGEAPTQEKVGNHRKSEAEQKEVEVMNSDLSSRGGLPSNGTISSNKMSSKHSDNADIEELPSICDEDSSEHRSGKGDDSSSSSSSEDKHEVNDKKWMAPWHWQFLVLAHRNFKQMRSSLLLSWMLWVQVSHCGSENSHDKYQ